MTFYDADEQVVMNESKATYETFDYSYPGGTIHLIRRLPGCWYRLVGEKLVIQSVNQGESIREAMDRYFMILAGQDRPLQPWEESYKVEGKVLNFVRKDFKGDSLNTIMQKAKFPMDRLIPGATNSMSGAKDMWWWVWRDIGVQSCTFAPPSGQTPWILTCNPTRPGMWEFKRLLEANGWTFEEVKLTTGYPTT